MFRTFPELGIEFAKEGAAVVLHTTSATVDPVSARPESPVAVAAS